MKRKDATHPLSIPSADDAIPELTAWIEALSLGTHAGYKVLTTASFAAKPPTLYIETTVVSVLAGWISRDSLTANMQLVTREWWESHRHKHSLFVSDIVLTEASRGDEEVTQERLEILGPLTILHPSDQTRELAKRILAECRLPEREYNDAHHAALCAIHGIQVLLTWNCAHLANVNMIPCIGRACEAYGYAPPAILTPQQLIGACAYGSSFAVP
jgi:predicted nucleic acid-binding protein